MAFAWLGRMFTQFDPILNRPLDRVEHDGRNVTFWFEDGKGVRYTVEGDCCSSSWIEHITIPSGIKGKVITEVKDAPMNFAGYPVDDGVSESDEYGEYIQVYHNAFVTDAGEIILEYRNSSNGYYGGYLVGPEVVESV